jgi:hypothetical protein
MEQLNEYLHGKMEDLRGSWISKNSGYENDLCIILGFNCQKERYWDCEYNDLYIEIKKGKSIWLDEVRYSEIFMGINDKCKQKTITIFLIPSKDKNKIENIIIVDSQKLIDYLKIDAKSAEFLLTRREIINRTLNCQQSVSLKDLKSMADYIVSS